MVMKNGIRVLIFGVGVTPLKPKH